MRPLKDEYTNGCLIYRVIRREGDIALVEVTTTDPEKNAWITNYEVWKIQKGKEREIQGRVIKASEHPPSSSECGSKGWSYINKEQAEDRFTKEVVCEEMSEMRV